MGFDGAIYFDSEPSMEVRKIKQQMRGTPGRLQDAAMVMTLELRHQLSLLFDTIYIP